MGMCCVTQQTQTRAVTSWKGGKGWRSEGGSRGRGQMCTYDWVLWSARRPNHSVLKEINPEYSWEGLLLKLQYFGHLMQRANALEKTLMLGKIEGRRRKGWQRMRRLDGITDSMDMSLGKLREMVKERNPGCCSPWGHRVRQDWATEQQNDCFMLMYGRSRGNIVKQLSFN